MYEIRKMNRSIPQEAKSGGVSRSKKTFKASESSQEQQLTDIEN